MACFGLTVSQNSRIVSRTNGLCKTGSGGIMSKEALLVIDVQTGIVGGEYAVYQAPELLKRIQKLIEEARAANVPVIYVQHDEAPEYDGVIHPDIAPKADEAVIHKFKPDAFFETNLQETLEDMGIRKLVLVGCQTDMCVNATTRKAAELGYDVHVVEDAHSTVDNEKEDAASVIRRHNEEFSKIARLVEADALKFDS
jgi:nicotinamidase-related amidase